jgi:hypothetical protein
LTCAWAALSVVSAFHLPILAPAVSSVASVLDKLSVTPHPERGTRGDLPNLVIDQGLPAALTLASFSARLPAQKYQSVHRAWSPQ